MSRRSQIKKDLISALRLDDLTGIFSALSGYGEAELLNPLFSAICHFEERIRWHAVSVFGRVMDAMAREDLESARVVMRRFLWSLNDESGGIGWGAPEAMAEIMAVNDTLFRDYFHMLLSYMQEDGPELFQDGNYLELPPLQRGVIWGVGRLAGRQRQKLLEAGVAQALLPYLHSPDGPVRGLAAWSLGNLRAAAAGRQMRHLLSDACPVSLYWQGQIIPTTVSRLASQAIADLK
ncbi:MAG: HEAT repeat domain-containing protein [Desulfocapsaceae bacterium]|nr:HEAT repeat domain-containing protein [Desulfocapsaceae bacterium]